MNIIRELISGFWERPLPQTKPRRVDLARVPGMASVVIGMRRSGKTYLLFRKMKNLLEAGADLRRMLYINFEDDRLHPLSDTVLEDTLETFFRMSPGGRDGTAHLFLDEIQAVPGWARFGRRVLDTEEVDLYVTGSSSKLLSREVASEFRGRGLTTELFPLNFSEALVFAGEQPPDGMVGPRRRSALESSLEEYLRVGGFPAVQELEELQRIQVLQDYVEIVLLRDVVERHGVSNAHAARVFSHALLQSVGSKFSVNRLYGDLKSRGIRIGRSTLYELLDHLTDAFLLFTVPIYSRSLRVRESNLRKIYAVDPGLVLAMAPAGTSDLGHRLECAVYLELRRRLHPGRSATVCYYQTVSGYEVDFVVGDPEFDSARALIGVCASLENPATRKRECRALKEGMDELGISRSTLITLHEKSSIDVEPGRIEVVPAWEWLLGLSAGPGKR